MHRVLSSGGGVTGYDVIGDVHGYADALAELLRTLGYRERDGAWRHAERTAVFVGDLVDRGPGQLETVRIVRGMVEAGSAQIVMGNHEFNAIAWATPDGDGGWYRAHSDKNLGQHARFLAAVGAGSALHDELIGWFRTIPLWLDLDGLRVVHACWHPASMGVLGDGAVVDEHVAAEKGSELYESIEVVLKGPEIDMDGNVYLDKDGHPRRKARFRWWSPDATTLRGAAEIPGDATAPDGTPFPLLPDTPLVGEWPAAPTDVPVLYGHYWRKGTPAVDVGDMSACLDWSVAKGGPLVAFRYSGESILDGEHLVAVYPGDA
jgi:hypothetical protein